MHASRMDNVERIWSARKWLSFLVPTTRVRPSDAALSMTPAAEEVNTVANLKDVKPELRSLRLLDL
jgi:hypothetical protein